jgi:molecular chaperone Hsp33
MDQLFYGFSKEKMISLTFADVTESAKSLEKKHLSGPTAGRFLGEALVSAALLSASLGDEDERISLQAQVDGPIGGCLVDASRNGNLRGYTMIKILNDFDHSDSTPLTKALGDTGILTFIHSNRRSVIAQHHIHCNPMNLRHGLARYFNDYQQKPTAIEISATSREHYIHHAVGICMSRLPEGQSEDFIPLLERFNDKTIEKALVQAVDIDILSKMLGLNDMVIIERRVLVAKCSCSHEKVLYSISCLPVEELEEILEKNEMPEVVCHFCSSSYHVETAEVARLLREKKEQESQNK